MTGADIAILVVKYGPIAFEWAERLAEVWTKQMTPEEVKVFCLSLRKSYDTYIENEKASRVTI